MVNKLRFCFDYGGYCLWSNDGAIKPDTLPISKSLIYEINKLCDEFDDSLDWKYPPGPSPWTKKKFVDFFDRADKACEKLQNELKEKYAVENCIDEDRHMYMDGRVFADEKDT